MSDTSALFDVLRNSVDVPVADAIERFVAEGSDRELCRVNVLAFAARNQLNEERTSPVSFTRPRSASSIFRGTCFVQVVAAFSTPMPR